MATPHDAELKHHDHVHVVLFEGVKAFWRTRQNVDMRIVEHLNGASPCVEIIGYETDLAAESPRIYLDSKKLYDRLDAAEVDEKINAKREEYTRMRKRVPVEELRRTILQQMAVTFILARLAIMEEETAEVTAATTPTTTADTNAEGVVETTSTTEAEADALTAAVASVAEITFRLAFVPASGDPVNHGKVDMLLPGRPAGLEEITIARRKKTSMQDFHKEMRALKADHAQLNHACADAQRKAGLAVQSTDAFKNMLRNRSTMDDSSFSMARKRWMWAGQKVILQNYVASVHRRLERYSMSAVPSESISRSGQELKDKLKNMHGGSGSLRTMRGSQSSFKLPSLSDSSRDSRDRRTSRDGNALRASLKKAPRELADFSKSLSIHVQERIEARENGNTRASRGSRTELGLDALLLPTITSSPNRPTGPFIVQ